MGNHNIILYYDNTSTDVRGGPSSFDIGEQCSSNY